MFRICVIFFSDAAPQAGQLLLRRDFRKIPVHFVQRGDSFHSVRLFFQRGNADGVPGVPVCQEGVQVESQLRFPGDGGTFRKHPGQVLLGLEDAFFTYSDARVTGRDFQFQELFLVCRQREVVLQVCLGLFGHIADEINIQPGRTGGVVRFRRGLSRCDESSQEHHQSCQSGNCFPDHIISPRHIMIMPLIH